MDSEEELSEIEADYEITQNANTEEIDFQTGEIVETTTVVDESNSTVPPAQVNIPEKRVERGF